MKCIKKKRAQVSIFIAVGVIILLSASVYFFVKDSREEVVPGVFISIQEIPNELEPVKTFITGCLESKSILGLKQLGEHGGYISLQDREITRQTFDIGSIPTNSQAVSFAPGSALQIPYWWYLESNNNCVGECTFTTKRPPLREGENSIKNQLDRFIKREITTCFDNFNTIKQQGFNINTPEDFEVDTKIAADDVIVILNYPTNIEKLGVEAEVDQYFVRIPIDLEQIYNTATEITNLQQRFRFLERQTMNLIASFSEIDSNKLPPFSGLEFEYGPSTRWVKSDVEKKVSEILSLYVSMFQVEGSNNYNRLFFESNIRQKLYDGMIVPGSEEYNKFDITFSYLDFWPIYFDLNCRGEICEPESASSNLLAVAGALMGIQRYNFAYDVSFPTLVEIYEPDALNGQGYKFNFFLEANVRNNQEMPALFTPLETAKAPQLSGLCDLSNRNSENVSIRVLDSVESTPITGVNIMLNVGGENCFIGQTEKNGILTAQFPTGTAGAAVGLARTDYIGKSQLFDASRIEKIEIETKLNPISTKKVMIRKKLVEKQGRQWAFTNNEIDLGQNEEAIISLTRISPESETEFASFVTIKGNNQEEIQIAPGQYELSINLFLREYLSIPERTIKKRVGLFDEQEFTLPGFEFNKQNPFPSGGLRLNVTFTEDDLKHDTITLYAVSPALQFITESERSIEDLDQIARIDEYSRVFSPLLKPSFE